MRCVALFCAVLVGCASSSPINWTDPERCARKYAPNIERMRRVYVDGGWKIERALYMEVAVELPLDPELQEIIEHAIGFVYTPAYRDWPAEKLKAAYIAECERRLGARR